MKIFQKIILVLLFLLIACEPAKLEVSDSDSTIKDIIVGMHGGSPVPENWSDCGGKIGDHPCNFSFKDQNGDVFELYKNYNKTILLDFSTMWCGVCNNIAHDSQKFMEEYGHNNFLWVTILVDNNYGDSVTQQDTLDWATLYGISDSPVLAGDRSVMDASGNNGYPVTSWPTIVILDKNMIIKYGINGWNEQTIKQWIELEL